MHSTDEKDGFNEYIIYIVRGYSEKSLSPNFVISALLSSTIVSLVQVMS
jgi:hypothetical protein